MRIVVDTNVFVSAAFKESSWPASIVRWVDKFGGLSTLVNTAGIFDTPSLDDMPRTHWDKTIAVNQSSIFLGAQTAVPELAKAKGAAIALLDADDSFDDHFHDRQLLAIEKAELVGHET